MVRSDSDVFRSIMAGTYKQEQFELFYYQFGQQLKKAEIHVKVPDHIEERIVRITQKNALYPIDEHFTQENRALRRILFCRGDL